MDGTIATIMMFAGNFAPKNWAFCNGQLLTISSNTALFSLLGTTYGGNGTTNFGLPDLQGRAPIAAGTGPGLSNYSLGQSSNTVSASLTLNQMPAHHHDAGQVKIPVSGGNASTEQPNGNILATPSSDVYATAGTQPTVNYGGFNVAVAPQGGGQPFSIMQPSLAINYVVCMYGIFPSRP
jgi:Microcystin-dependent protein